MLKHEQWKSCNKCLKTENNKVIQWGNVYIGDLKGASKRSSNDKDSCWKYN